MRWMGTATTGAPGEDHEAGVLPLAAYGVAAAKVEVLQGISQGVLPEAGQGHPAALHGLCRGAPLCQNRLGPAPCHPMSCRRMIRIIKSLLMLLGFERLRLEGRELPRKFL